MMPQPFDKCPACGGELVEKEVGKLLQGGGNTAEMKARAMVCLHCGERLYDEHTVHRFEQIRRKLQRQDTKGFHPIGQAFEVKTDSSG